MNELIAAVDWTSWAVLSPLVIATFAVVMVVLERRFPYTPGQRLFREGFFMDFALYTLVQSYFVGLLVSAIVVYLDESAGLSRLHLVSNWPVWMQLVFFSVIHDLYIYSFHRLQHKSKWLWRTHEAHHSVRDVDWVAGSRSHALEILINGVVEFAPMTMLGASPEVPIMKATLSACWGMFIHSNIDVRLGRLQYVINGPEMHRWHHAQDLPPPAKNFSTKLAIWDWLFGSAYLPEHKPTSYGLWGDPPFPKGYIGQFFAAFRPMDAPSADATEPTPPVPRPPMLDEEQPARTV